MFQENLIKDEEQVTIPTKTQNIKEFLRTIGEPITLFGEKDAERRNRLGNEISKATFNEAKLQQLAKKAFVIESHFSEASTEIRNTRIWLAKFSIARVYFRFSRQKIFSNDESSLKTRNYISGSKFNPICDLSEVADDRPITCCAFTSDGRNFLTASISGNLSVWSTSLFKKLSTIKAHEERITGITVNPKSNQNHLDNATMATSSADRTTRIWTFNGTLLSTLFGHNDSLSGIEFHPSGRFLVTSSLDQTWSLWDVEKALAITKTIGCHGKNPLYKQDGHHQPLYSISFQNDGSLLASGGVDKISRVWDLRTGRCIMTLEGHAQAILALDFSVDGYRIVSGSLDQSCQIWDLRKAKCEYTIAAHNKLVKAVRCHPCKAEYFVSVGYDKEVRVWSLKNYKLIRILTGHGDKVTGVDVSSSFTKSKILSVSYDKTVKLW